MRLFASKFFSDFDNTFEHQRFRQASFLEWDDGRMPPEKAMRVRTTFADLERMLDAYADRHGGMVFVAPLDIVFSDYDVLQPDVLFFQAARVHLLDLYKVTRSAPDIAVEVLSPSTRSRDRSRKMETYARYGVSEYWLVDPIARSIDRFELAGGGFTPAQTALPPMSFALVSCLISRSVSCRSSAKIPEQAPDAYR